MINLPPTPLRRWFVGCSCIFFLSTTVITHEAYLSPTEEAKQGLVLTTLSAASLTPNQFLACAMCCNLEFLVWKMSSKGKPREGVNSMEALSCNALAGGFNSPGAARRGGEGRTCLKKQTHVGLKSCQEAEKTQGSTQRKLNDTKKYINKNRLKKYLLSFSYLPGPPQVCKLVHSILLGVCF